MQQPSQWGKQQRWGHSSVGKSSCSEGINSSPSCAGSRMHFYSSQPIAYSEKEREILPKEKVYYRGYFQTGPPSAAASRPPGGALPGRARSWRGAVTCGGAGPSAGVGVAWGPVRSHDQGRAAGGGWCWCARGRCRAAEGARTMVSECGGVRGWWL